MFLKKVLVFCFSILLLLTTSVSSFAEELNPFPFPDFQENTTPVPTPTPSRFNNKVKKSSGTKSQSEYWNIYAPEGVAFTLYMPTFYKNQSNLDMAFIPLGLGTPAPTATPVTTSYDFVGKGSTEPALSIKFSKFYISNLNLTFINDNVIIGLKNNDVRKVILADSFGKVSTGFPNSYREFVESTASGYSYQGLKLVTLMMQYENTYLNIVDSNGNLVDDYPEYAESLDLSQYDNDLVSAGNTASVYNATKFMGSLLKCVYVIFPYFIPLLFLFLTILLVKFVTG